MINHDPYSEQPNANSLVEYNLFILGRQRVPSKKCPVPVSIFDEVKKDPLMPEIVFEEKFLLQDPSIKCTKEDLNLLKAKINKSKDNIPALVEYLELIKITTHILDTDRTFQRIKSEGVLSKSESLIVFLGSRCDLYTQRDSKERLNAVKNKDQALKELVEGLIAEKTTFSLIVFKNDGMAHLMSPGETFDPEL